MSLSPLRYHSALLLVLLIYFAVTNHTVWRVPLSLGPDEAAHFTFARFLEKKGFLPFTPADRKSAGYKSDQPPLNAALVALAFWGDLNAPPFVKLANGIPRRHLAQDGVVDQRGVNKLWDAVNTEDPLAGEFLFWRFGRLWSTILSGMTLVIIYFIALKTFEDRPQKNLYALSAVTSVAFIPAFTFISGMFNYESLLSLWLSLYLLVAVHLIKGNRAGWLYWLAGLFIGLAIVTKLSALPAPLSLVVLILLVGYQANWPKRFYLTRLAISITGLLLGAGWWFALVEIKLNKVEAMGWFAGLLYPIIVGDGSEQTSAEILNFLSRGALEQRSIPLTWVTEWAKRIFETLWFRELPPAIMIGFLYLMTAIILIGLIKVWQRNRPSRTWLIFLCFHTLLFFILPLVRFLVIRQIGVAGQGHHVLFPAVGAFAILITWGLSAWLPTPGEDHEHYISRWVKIFRWPALRSLRLTLDCAAAVGSLSNGSAAGSQQSYFPGEQWLGGILLGVGLLGWSIMEISHYHSPVPVPVSTVSSFIPPTASQVELDFGPMTLKGYELVGLVDEDLSPTSGKLRKNEDLSAVSGQRSAVVFSRGVCCEAGYPALGVKLYWLAEEFAPEDYLATISLQDERNEVQSVWVGHGAGGRYPTRAWEPGDIIRDEIWLPIVGLKPGLYKINLELSGIHFSLMNEGDDSIFDLATIELAQTVPTLDVSTEPPIKPAFEIWQKGQVVSNHLPVFEHRATIQVTTAPNANVNLVGPDQMVHSPIKTAGRTRVFVVDALWPIGQYQLQLNSGNQTEQLSGPALAIEGLQRQTQIPDSQFSVRANFANQLMLLGYNLPKRHLRAGESLPITLHWQALQTPPADFIMFTRLRDETGQVWGGYDRWPREAYSPFLWVAGEVVEDGFTVKVDPAASPGLYYLDVGFYLTQGNTSVSLPLVQDGRMSEVTNVTMGPFKIGDTLPSGVSTELPEPQTSLHQPFGAGPNLTLLGYDLTRPISQVNSSPTGDSIKLTLYWRAESPLSIDYTTFVHIRNSAGEIVAQKDQPPLNGAYPTSLWQPGEIITDEIVIPLPSSLPADKYSLLVGLYDINTGIRLAIPNQPDNSVTLIEEQITKEY